MVTGGAGFIDSNLVDYLTSRVEKVVVVDNLYNGKLENVHRDAIFKFYSLNQTYIERLVEFIKEYKIDTIFHMAAAVRMVPSIEESGFYYFNNLNSTIHVLEAAKKANIANGVVYSSSSSVYGDHEKTKVNHLDNALKESDKLNPLTPYAHQKLMGEEMCRMYSKYCGVNTICLRYFNVYGKRQVLGSDYSAVIGKFLDQAKKKEPLTIYRTGHQTRDFTNVADIVTALNKAGEYMKDMEMSHETFNVGAGSNMSINDIAHIITEQYEKQTGSMLGKRFIENPPSFGFTEVDNTLANINRTKKQLDWEPTHSLRDFLINEVKKIK